MKKPLFAAFVLAIFMTSCGPDSILVESGKTHSCKLKELQEKMDADPSNVELQNEFKETTQLLNAVIETADEGDQEALKNAIIEASKDC